MATLKTADLLFEEKSLFIPPNEEIVSGECYTRAKNLNQNTHKCKCVTAGGYNTPRFAFLKFVKFV